MRRNRTLTLVVIVALLTAIGPPVAAILLAQQQGVQIAMSQARSYARVVAERSDRAVTQMQASIDRMLALNITDPCSDAMLLEMRSLGLSMEFMKVVGALNGRQLLCSTLGIHRPALDLGPADEVTPLGTELRLSAPMPLATDTPYISIARDGFVAMAHRNQAVDLAVDLDGAIFATFNPATSEIRTVSGAVMPHWVTMLGDRQAGEFIDNGYVVAILYSSQVNATGALAAIPLQYVDERIYEISIRLLPVSLLAALILTLTFLYVARNQTSLASQIRQGLRRGQFYLEYQPVIELKTGAWTGAEALVRWRRPDGEIMLPDTFIPAAEQSGLITRITERVIELVEADLGDFLRENPLMMVAINLSSSDLESPAAAQSVIEMIERSSLSPGQIMIEMTERVIVNPEQARTVLEKLQAFGVRVAIDDFGTGYSSLSYLETMPFDCLKIDRLFVEAIDTDAATSRVVLHIIEMAATLGLNVVAEGVETEAQASYLKERGVRYAQGWLYSKSLAAADFMTGYRPGPAT